MSKVRGSPTLLFRFYMPFGLKLFEKSRKISMFSDWEFFISSVIILMPNTWRSSYEYALSLSFSLSALTLKIGGDNGKGGLASHTKLRCQVDAYRRIVDSCAHAVICHIWCTCIHTYNGGVKIDEENTSFCKSWSR